MGYYLNHDSTGKELPAKGKVEVLLATGGEKVHGLGLTFQPNLVCVVDNGVFEAAAFAYDRDEMNVFNSPRDMRHKVWLTYPGAAEISGYEEAERRRNG